MRLRLWLVVSLACCGAVAACSSVGHEDGAGGSAGVTSAGAGGAGGALSVGGTGGFSNRGGPAGAGPSGVAGSRTPGANDLSCLKGLFADCPTDVGTCQWDISDHSGVDGSIGGSGGIFTGWSTYCFSTGTTATYTGHAIDCPNGSSVQGTELQVRKPDGSLCYSWSVECDCLGCQTRVTTVRDASGAIVGSGTVVFTATPGVTTSFACANGDVCQDLPLQGNCEPRLSFSSQGCDRGLCPGP